MRKDLLDRLPILCAGCRADGRESALRIASAARESPAGEVIEGSLACPEPGCGRAFPIVDGVPILVDALLEYVREERAAIERRRDLGPETRSLLEEAAGDEDEEALRARDLATYAAAHEGIDDGLLAPLSTPLRALVDEMLALHGPKKIAGKPLRGLDAGCAVGGFTRALGRRVDLAVGIDLAFELVRDARERSASSPEMQAGTAFAVASVEAPPFPRAAFEVVLALNVIDAVEHPRDALAALDAALRPGGLLVLSTPFHYRDARTPREERIVEPDLLPALGGLGYDVLEDRPRVPWLLPLGSRHHELFLVRAIAARKRATAGGKKVNRREET